MTLNSGAFLSTSKKDCCEEHYSFALEKCVGGATATSGSKYYPDWESGDDECSNDGNAPDYMVANENLWLFDDQDDCCEYAFFTLPLLQVM
jgi:hypothetical protein